MRHAEVVRKTSETNIRLSLNLDGSGESSLQSGIGFFDHMLTHVAKHGLMDVKLVAAGDLEVDYHHTVEDTGICFGRALKIALGDGAGVNRYGAALIPMDESLAQAAVDISGRPRLLLTNPLADRRAGDFLLDLIEVFLAAMCDHAGLTMHVDLLRGENPHHAAEAVFKAVGRALRLAVDIDPRRTGSSSTKGLTD
jgi:imidazoleglycerol-phosphate dehydratase